MSLLEVVIFFSLWAFGLGQLKLEQSEISISRVRAKSAHVSCKVSSSTFSTDYIHWYRQKPDQGIEHLIYVYSTTPAHGKNNKFEASKNLHTSTSILKINFLEKQDEAVYFCACWTDTHSVRVAKIPAQEPSSVCAHTSSSIWATTEPAQLGTQPEPPSTQNSTIILAAEITYNVNERSLDSSDTAPKPTIFLPSVAEINLHKAGTYLCLLEKFFPDVIKVYWKEKDGNTILASQQGSTTKTNDTYMKFSWLTVTAKSMDKEHKCIVKHENNKRGDDQEILFPSINKGDGTEAVRMQDHEPRNAKNKSLESEKEIAVINSTTEYCLKDKSDLLQMQLAHTAACCAYLLLLFKSLLYVATISFRLFRRTAVCGRGKSS